MTGSVLALTGHPLQRCGARALALLAKKESTEQITVRDLDEVARRVVSHAVAAAVAPKDSTAYDWWKVLFALYPNAKPTHARRARDPAILTPEVEALFAPDSRDARLRPCTFCGAASGVLWAKKTMPLFDSDRALNTLPPGTTGWPVCRACRVSLWTLPYGAWLTAGSATVLRCDDPAVEENFVRHNVLRAERIRQLGFAGLRADAGPEAVTVQALRTVDPSAEAVATLWSFKNDNQEPWLRTASTRLGTARFLRAMFAEPACRAAWFELGRALERRDKDGHVTVDRHTAAARTLFNRDGEQHDQLLRALFVRSLDVEKVTARTLHQRRRLSHLYLKEMYEMKVDDLQPAKDLLVAWIKRQSSRGRFNEYKKAAANPYELRKLLMNVAARQLLDGARPLDMTKVEARLLAAGGDGWRWRTSLFFQVVAELAESGEVGAAPEEDGDEDPVTFEEQDEQMEEYA